MTRKAWETCEEMWHACLHATLDRDNSGHVEHQETGVLVYDEWYLSGKEKWMAEDLVRIMATHDKNSDGKLQENELDDELRTKLGLNEREL